LAALHHAGHRDRHLPQRPQPRDDAAEDRRGALGRLTAQHAHQLAQDVVVLHEALGARPLEGEFARDLQPAIALVANQAALGNEGVAERDLVPIVPAGEVDDWPDGDVGRLEIDQELAQPLVPIAVLPRGAHQRDTVVVAMCTRGPDLGAVDAEAAWHRLGARAHRGEVRARIGLAHADREVALARRDLRQDRLALLLVAETQQQRTRLAVGDPVRAGRRAVAQQLLGDDVALEEALLRAAVLLGPGDADPALLAEFPREGRRKGIPAGEAVFGL